MPFSDEHFQPGIRPFALHRNGYAGLQRYGWLWSGDTLSTWATLAAQVSIGINAGLCGLPYWGTDTGGFVPTREFTAELFVRWFQFSAFCPMFRVHGDASKGAEEPKGAPGKEMWQFAPETQKILIDYDKLRYHLLPYIYSVAWKVTSEGSTCAGW